MSTVTSKKTNFEILVAIGRRMGQRLKILVVAKYLAPSYDADTTEACLNEVNDTVLTLRRRYDNPYVIVAGDFNKRDMRKATANFPNIKPAHIPPTQGRSVLDIVMVSFTDSLINSSRYRP